MVRATKWRVLVRMIWFISTSVTHSLLITLKYRQCSAFADLHTFQFTDAHTLGFCFHCLSCNNGSLQITMKSSCYFVFSHSVLHCPNQYTINPRNSLRTRSILFLILSNIEPSWILHFALFVWFCHYHFSLRWTQLNSELRTLSLTYIAEGPTSTNSKHISRDPYPLLLCDVTVHA
jgi:hypothetical protein